PHEARRTARQGTRRAGDSRLAVRGVGGLVRGPFDSAWFKWSRGVVHTKAFEAEVERLARDPDINPKLTLTAEYDAKRHGFIPTITSMDPPPLEWSLTLGDIVHNYRSCLDHVAWALYQRGRRVGTLTTRQERRIGFPIS